MRNTFKKTFAAAAFALFVALPLGAHAADQSGPTAASAPATVKEALKTIASTPLSIDGGPVVKGSSKMPFARYDSTIAQCVVVCTAGACEEYCW